MGESSAQITFRGDSARPRPQYGRRNDLRRRKGSNLRKDDGVRGEERGSGLWGTGRGGQSSTERRDRTVKRGLLALLVLALAAPLAATAGGHGHRPGLRRRRTGPAPRPPGA